MTKLKIEVGDRITFCAPTRAGEPKATRVVNGFWFNNPTVRFHGYSDFVVGWHEIIHIEKAKDRVYE